MAETERARPARPARVPARPEPARSPPAQRPPVALAPPGPTAPLRRGAGPGEPLPGHIAGSISGSLGVDVADVRVHSDSAAAAAARALGARAFAVGRHVFLGRGEKSTNLSLMAHEVAHVVQQQAAPRLQLWSSAGGDRYEREAHQASVAVLRSEPYTVRERTSPRIQRLGISDALDYFADKANLIPGYRMFTILLGVNPINMSRVERSAANILRAIVEFLPGGYLITQALDKYGVFDKVGNWVEQQLRTLGITGSMIKNAISEFLDSLSWRDIFRLGSVWDRAKRIFTEPIRRIIDFGIGLVAGILRFIKEAILRPLAKLAEGTPGYDLLKAVLGEDPITGDPVPQTADALIGGFMKLIGQEEVWRNLQRARAVPRAFAWFKGVLSGVLAFVRAIPQVFISALQSLEIADIVILPRAFNKVGRAFGGFIGNFFSWGFQQVLSLLQIIFEVLIPGAMPYIRKAAGAFKQIIQNPVRFIGNLVRAGIQGFRQFASNFLAHLRASLIQWLTGSLGGAGIYIPQAFEIREIIKFVLSVLGLTWQNIRAKLVRAIGEPAVKAMETAFDIVVTLVKEGPAAAWEKIKEQLSNLRELVMGEVMNFVRDRIVQQAIRTLLTSLNPAGAFIQAVIAIYNTVMFFIERLRQIAQVAMSFIDSIAAIAAGAIGAAANRVEQTMAGFLTLVISFLARIAGLGRVSDAVINIVNKIRAPIDKALDKVVEWIVNMARRLGRFIAQAGVPQDPAQRLELGLNAAVSAVNALSGTAVTATLIDPVLAAIRVRYGFRTLQAVAVDGIWWVEGQVNPPARKRTSKQAGGAGGKPDGSQAKPFPITWPKRPAAQYNAIWLAPADRVTAPLTQARVRALPGAARYSATGSKAVPGGGDTIGIATPYQTRVGLVVGPKKTGRSDSEKDRFNRLLAKHGYDRSEEPTDGDHVVEAQVSGPDSFPNLWPLNSSENRSGGSTLSNTEVDLPDGTKKKVRDLAGKFFKIIGFG